MAVAALGVARLALAVLSFSTKLFDDSDKPKASFNFYIGSDGASDPSDPNDGALNNAGGNLPDIRIWEENGNFIDIKTNDGNKCKDGSVVCNSAIEDVEVQPTYSLFTGNDDALCISYATVNFPGDTSMYATTIGGWARLCSEKYDGRGGSWYWSDVVIQPKEGASFKTECAWIDKDGDQKTTGISLHWTEFDGAHGIKKDQDVSYFCNNDAVMQFHTEEDPKSIKTWTNKRDLFSRDPSTTLATTPADAMVKRQRATEAKAKRTTSKFAGSLVKSKSKDHNSKELCTSKTSAGPSFVSYDERMFCHMETKTLYPFCEDVHSGACFDDQTNKVKMLGDKNGKRGDLPALDFTHVTTWE
ncbi:hypothetical protein F4777DRAFT_75776 [Nemania sp. FL0916]|nr:hypothetical protein F4777DRAFT_75776 [Nemania sp. FL0916]